MDRFLKLEGTLVDSEIKKLIKYNKEEKYFEGIDNNKFEILNGIPNFFVGDSNKISLRQSEFYNEVKFPNYDEIDDFGTLLDKSQKSIFFRKLDDEIPMHSKVLEAGCGTGQLSLFLSRYERQIFAIDLSNGSLTLGENFRQKNNIENLFFFKMSIFNMFFPENFFDVIISNGVLHHTENPKSAFIKLTKHLRKNGYIIIGLYHKYGRIYTNIRQFFIKIFGDKLKFLDKNTQDPNFSKQQRFAWFMDQYKNPKESSHTFNEVLNWFSDANIDFISSIPFSFPQNSIFEKKLFSKNDVKPKFELYLNEISQAFISHQIKEGGFFIMIGKKK